MLHSLLTSFFILLAFGNSDIRQPVGDVYNRDQPMQVPVVINPDGSRTIFQHGERVIVQPPAPNPTSKYCEELTKEGVTGADWARYCK
jgi:hypothetical protein